jgi:hypothetical protein
MTGSLSKAAPFSRLSVTGAGRTPDGLAAPSFLPAFRCLYSEAVTGALICSLLGGEIVQRVTLRMHLKEDLVIHVEAPTSALVWRA